MSASDRHGDCLYDTDGQPMLIACAVPRRRPPCTYCDTESTRACDAPGRGRFGRCGTPMCGNHSAKVGKHHDLCREHAAAGDHAEMIRGGETATNVWWEIVETKAAPIPGTAHRLFETGHRLGVDPDDEVA
jgi:hypothetical protein